MVKKIASRYNLRILNSSTQDKINSVLKLKKSSTINSVLNECLEIGATVLLDNESLVNDTFGEQLEKNTKKITAKLNKLQNENNKMMLKILCLLLTQEKLNSASLNLLLFNNDKNNNSIDNILLQEFAENLPDVIDNFKEKLVNNLFGDDINNE